MARPRKDYVILNVKLDRLLHDQFKSYADELGQTKTTALERILRKHLIDCGYIQEKKENMSNVAKDKSSSLD